MIVLVSRPFGLIYRFFARLAYLVLLLTLGLPFAALKWLLLGTRGGRENRKLMRMQRKLIRMQRKGLAR